MRRPSRVVRCCRDGIHPCRRRHTPCRALIELWSWHRTWPNGRPQSDASFRPRGCDRYREGELNCRCTRRTRVCLPSSVRVEKIDCLPHQANRPRSFSPQSSLVSRQCSACCLDIAFQSRRCKVGSRHRSCHSTGWQRWDETRSSHSRGEQRIHSLVPRSSQIGIRERWVLQSKQASTLPCICYTASVP